MIERTRAGLAAAAANGRKGGAPPQGRERRCRQGPSASGEGHRGQRHRKDVERLPRHRVPVSFRAVVATRLNIGLWLRRDATRTGPWWKTARSGGGGSVSHGGPLCSRVAGSVTSPTVGPRKWFCARASRPDGADPDHCAGGNDGGGPAPTRLSSQPTAVPTRNGHAVSATPSVSARGVAAPADRAEDQHADDVGERSQRAISSHRSSRRHPVA